MFTGTRLAKKTKGFTLIFPWPSCSKDDVDFKKINGFSGTVFPSSVTWSLKITNMFKKSELMQAGG